MEVMCQSNKKSKRKKVSRKNKKEKVRSKLYCDCIYSIIYIFFILNFMKNINVKSWTKEQTNFPKQLYYIYIISTSTKCKIN